MNSQVSKSPIMPHPKKRQQQDPLYAGPLLEAMSNVSKIVFLAYVAVCVTHVLATQGEVPFWQWQQCHNMAKALAIHYVD